MSVIREIDARTLKQWIDADEVDLIDVREPYEYKAGHIDGAILAPIGGLQLSDISAKLRSGKKLVLYCKAGVRSYAGCQKLKAEGVQESWNFVCGFDGWQAMNWSENN